MILLLIAFTIALIYLKIHFNYNLITITHEIGGVILCFFALQVPIQLTFYIYQRKYGDL